VESGTYRDIETNRLASDWLLAVEGVLILELE
jgi:hypothetical protein